MHTGRLASFMAAMIVAVSLWAQELPTSDFSLPLEVSAGASVSRARSYISLPLAQAAMDALTAQTARAAGELIDVEALFLSGRYTEAAQMYRAYIVNNPISQNIAQARLRLAECLLAQNRIDDARLEYAEVGEAFLNSDMRGELAFGAGVCMLAHGDDAAAAEQFEKVQALRTSLTAASNFFLGVIAYNAGDYIRATALFNSTDASRAPGNRRDVYLASMEGEPVKALGYARRALRQPSLSESEKSAAEFAAGQALWQMGETRSAVEHLVNHVRLTDEPVAAAWYMLGVDAYRCGDYAKAIDLLQTASSKGGEIGQYADVMLGQAYASSGNNTAAADAFMRAANDGGDPTVARTAHYNYLVTAFGGVDDSTSLAPFEDFLSRYSSGLYTDRIHTYLAKNKLKSGDYAGALEHAQSVENPTETSNLLLVQSLYRLAVEALNEGDNGLASRYISAAMPLVGEGRLAEEISLLQSQLLVNQENYREAERLLLSYLGNRNALNRPCANYYLGYAQLGLQRYNAADEAFAAAESSHAFTGRELADIHNRRGDLAYYARNFEQARSHYAQAERANPSNGDGAAYRQAKMLGYNRDYQGQIAKLNEFMHDFPNSAYMPDALLDKAAAQVALGNSQGAINTYDRLIANYPQSQQCRNAYLQKAMTLADMGGFNAEANAIYWHIVRNYPNTPEAAHAREMIGNFVRDIDENDVAAEGSPAMSQEVNEHHTAAEAAFGAANRDYAETGSTTSLLRFIDDYPAANQLDMAHNIVAHHDYEEGRVEESLERWQLVESLTSRPSLKLESWIGVLRSSRDLGLLEESNRVAEAILGSREATDEQKAEATFVHGMFMYERNDVQGAINAWESIAGRTDAVYGVKAAYHAAESLYELGELDRALAGARALSSSHSPHSYWIARSFILQSDILKAKGRTTEAREYLRALQNNYPGEEPDIHEMIRERLEAL